jgi:putative tryptophan/tyrosine transport system substrate-binding protein
LARSAAWPFAVGAQQAMPVVGFLDSKSPEDSAPLVAEFRRGLNETTFFEGQNVAIEFRWAQNKYDQLPVLAADLVRRRVDVIAATGGPAALAAKAASTTIPIVFRLAADPIAAGLVASLSRPGGNLTGVNIFSSELSVKRLQLLHDFVSAATLVAMLVNPTITASPTEVREVQAAADKIGWRIRILNVSTDREIDAAFVTIVEQRIGGLFVQAEPFLTSRRDQLVLLTTRHAVPTIFPWREFAAAGGLISYGTSLTAAYRQVGVYAGRILKGEKPAELPVVQPTKFELVINLKSARVLGLDVPPKLLALADEVIE